MAVKGERLKNHQIVSGSMGIDPDFGEKFSFMS